MAELPVIVLTPVRNEAWALPRFLEVTSHFADRIVIAYQESQDSSLEICQQHPLTSVIENSTRDFNEAERQCLLIEAARSLVAGPKILLALDADEILAFSALNSTGWKQMLQAEQGTAVEFDVVDMLPGLSDCITYRRCAPVAFIDDGTVHRPEQIHSPRLPAAPSARCLRVTDVHVMHYALANPSMSAAKHRFYSVMEKLMRPQSHVLQRRHTYPSRRNWRGAAFLREEGASIRPVPPEWIAGWEAKGIDMRTISANTFSWHDIHVLEMFERYGTRRFWLDDLWEFDWRNLQFQIAESAGLEVPPPLAVPPKSLRRVMRAMDHLYAGYAQARAMARRAD